jgi:hypothetical protein
MAHNHDLVKCPLCEGHGNVRPTEILQLLRDQTLEIKIDRGLAEGTMAADETADLTAVATSRAEPRNFQKEVHSWNPQLPTWRRSPKE